MNQPDSDLDLFQEVDESVPVVPTSRHILVTAYAGTGKTFTEIVGCAWAYAQPRWKEIQRRIAERRNMKAGRQVVDPDTFEITPTEEQFKVWQAMASDKPQSVTYCAFNKSIVTEFESEWGWMREILDECGVRFHFATVNGLGFKTCLQRFGKLDPNKNHVRSMLLDRLGLNPREIRGNRVLTAKIDSVCALTRMCKLNLTGWVKGEEFFPYEIDLSEFDTVARTYDIECVGDKEEIFKLTRSMLDQSLQPYKYGKIIDFDDQNWLPVVLDLRQNQVDDLLVDEAQDLNRAKQEYAMRGGRRLIVVGDANQSIYAFAGADVESIPRMQRLLGIDTPLKLTETRRCGKAIVKEANQVVPDFRAHPSNPEGGVYETDTVQYEKIVEDGDMVLCRSNAPLISEALRFLKNGRKAIIRGREIGQTLTKLVNSFKATDVPDLIGKADDWRIAETKMENAKQSPLEHVLIAIQDKFDCIHAFSQGAKSIDDVLRKIQLVFVGKECPKCKDKYDEEVAECWKCKVGLVTPKGILFSSGHKAKGLESSRVFILRLKRAPIPHPMARTPSAKGQEMNLLYVMITRAINELYWVYDPPKGKE